MGKSLVIVESPAKAKTINKYLGNQYVVKSSIGHIRDLPTSGSASKEPAKRGKAAAVGQGKGKAIRCGDGGAHQEIDLGLALGLVSTQELRPREQDPGLGHRTIPAEHLVELLSRAIGIVDTQEQATQVKVEPGRIRVAA